MKTPIACALLWGLPACATDNECQLYVDEAPAAEVSVTVRNEGQSAIFLRNTDPCLLELGLDVEGADGRALTWRSSCGAMSCESRQANGLPVCPGACGDPVVMIAPGGHLTLGWNGTYFADRTMPAACYGEDASPGDTCQQRVLAPEGDYTLSVNAHDALSCASSECECEPNEDGSCVVTTGSPVMGAARTGSVVVALSSMGAADIVFGDAPSK